MLESQAENLPKSILPESAVNTSELYDNGFLRVEHDHYYVACGGELVRLQRAEFLIVSVLAKNADRFVRCEDIWDYVWRGAKPYNPESLKVLIYNLRRHFTPYDIAIETMIKVGYKLVTYPKKS